MFVFVVAPLVSLIPVILLLMTLVSFVTMLFIRKNRLFSYSILFTSLFNIIYFTSLW